MDVYFSQATTAAGLITILQYEAQGTEWLLTGRQSSFCRRELTLKHTQIIFEEFQYEKIETFLCGKLETRDIRIKFLDVEFRLI